MTELEELELELNKNWKHRSPGILQEESVHVSEQANAAGPPPKIRAPTWLTCRQTDTLTEAVLSKHVFVGKILKTGILVLAQNVVHSTRVNSSYMANADVFYGHVFCRRFPQPRPGQIHEMLPPDRHRHRDLPDSLLCGYTWLWQKYLEVGDVAAKRTNFCEPQLVVRDVAAVLGTKVTSLTRRNAFLWLEVTSVWLSVCLDVFDDQRCLAVRLARAGAQSSRHHVLTLKASLTESVYTIHIGQTEPLPRSQLQGALVH